MDLPLYNSFKIQIESLSLFDFQNFIIKLFILRYGAENFIPPRDIKDKGADGIIVDQNTVIACYGPKKIDKNRYLTKIVEDFNSYEENWAANYPNWMFVTNNEIPEYAISKINSLKRNVKQIGIKNLLQFIEDLPHHSKRQLAEYLSIDKTFLSQDYLKGIIEDLIKDASFTPDNIHYQQRIDFLKKIQLNYEQEDIDGALDEYDSFIENGVFNVIGSLLSAYEDEDFEKLKHRILYDYMNKSGVFKIRLKELTEQYLAKYSSNDDDVYLYYVRAVLMYLFEQCLIGKKNKD